MSYIRKMAASGENKADVRSTSGIEEVYDMLKNPHNLRKETVKDLYDRWSLDYEKVRQ